MQAHADTTPHLSWRRIYWCIWQRLHVDLAPGGNATHGALCPTPHRNPGARLSISQRRVTWSKPFRPHVPGVGPNPALLLSLLLRLLVVIPSMQQPQRPSAPFSAGPTESVGSFGIGLAGGGASGAAGGVPVYGSVGGGGSVGFPAPAPLTVVTGESLSVFAGWVGATVECCGLCNCCNER